MGQEQVRWWAKDWSEGSPVLGSFRSAEMRQIDSTKALH